MHEEQSKISRTQVWLNNSWNVKQHADVQQAYQQFSDSSECALIFEDLARYAGLRQSSFNPSGQLEQMAFAEGQRDLMMHFLEMTGMDLVIAPKSMGSLSRSIRNLGQRPLDNET